MVSNVIYGRTAIITATSAQVSSALTASLERALSVVDVASVSASDSAALSAFFNTATVKVKILGGNSTSAAAVAVGSLQDFKDHIKGIDPTVAGGLGIPLAYVFRYVSDDAPALIKGVSEFDEVECRKARRLKVSGTLKVTKVSDFGGDEELYGSIKVKLGCTSKTLWSVGAGNARKKGTNETIGIDEIEFNVDPELISSEHLKLTFKVKDKIESGAEWFGASDQAKSDGFVAYSPGDREVNVQDVQNANGGILTRSYTLAESAAELKATMTFKLVE